MNSLFSVTPAKAGAQLKPQVPSPAESWIPAFAGMTRFGFGISKSTFQVIP
jgi:hypothetical protein